MKKKHCHVAVPESKKIEKRRMDHLDPYFVVPNDNDVDSVEVSPFYLRTIEGVEVEQTKLCKIHSPLLKSIDNNDVKLLKKCLKKDRVLANQQYLIPKWDIPETKGYQVEPLLHRAIWNEAIQVMKELLEQGASPRSVGYLGTNALDNVFDRYRHRPTKMLQMGKLLIKSGITLKELKRAISDNRPPMEVKMALLYHCSKHKLGCFVLSSKKKGQRNG